MLDKIRNFFNFSQRAESPKNQSIFHENLLGLISKLACPTPQWSDYSVENAVRKGYTNSIWVGLSVEKIAQSITSAKFAIKNSKDETVKNHPLVKLFNNPNPSLPSYVIWQTMWMHAELSGNGYLLKLKIGNRTKELWPMFPDKIRTIPSELPGKLIDKYEFHSGSSIVNYQPEQVIHFKYIDPSNLLQGIPPYKRALKNVDINGQQDDWNYYSLFNRFEPSMLISYASQMSEDQLKTAAEKIREKYKSVKKAREPLIASGVEKIEKLSYTSAEMDFIDGKKMTREEICLAFGVPPILVGLAENASLNNVKEYQKIFWEHTLLPKLEAFAQTLTWAFRDELGEGNYITFDTKHIQSLQADFTEVCAQALNLSYLGVDLAEINSRLDMGLNLDNIQNPNTKDQNKGQNQNKDTQNQATDAVNQNA